MNGGNEVREFPFSDSRTPTIDPVFGQLRAAEPVARIRLPYGGEAWLVTRYADNKQVLTDRRFSRAKAVGEDIPRLTVEPPGGSGLTILDPPEHTRLRRLVSSAFSVRRVEALRPRVEEVTERLLSRMIEQGPPVDLVEAFALPLPMMVICELLGVPYEDRDKFAHLAKMVLSVTAYTREQVRAAVDELTVYLCDLIDLRRERPEDDLYSALIRARDDEDRLSDQELVTLCGNLLAAGYENVANSIANFTYLLLTSPPRWHELHADRRLVPGAVEELLRYVMFGRGVSHARIATEDVEIAGVLIREGDAVFASVPAANHDPDVFTRPNRLDFRRDEGNHLTFGLGVHHCLGAQLARMELRIALGTLVDRLPQLRLAVPEDEISWKTGLTAHGVDSLPVEW